MTNVTEMRQQLREEYMERIYRFGHKCSELTEQANIWWPDTVPTTWEMQEQFDTHLTTYSKD